MRKEDKKQKNLWSILLLSLTILTLVSVLSFCLYGMYGLTSMIHYQKMDELRLEKDIAIINNPEDTKFIDYSKLNIIIDKIQKDCGSTFIVKQYGSNEWSTFHALEDDMYLELNKCFKGVSLN